MWDQQHVYNVYVCGCSGAVGAVGTVGGPPPAHHASGARLPGYLQPYSPTYLVPPQHHQQHLWYTDWTRSPSTHSRIQIPNRLIGWLLSTLHYTTPISIPKAIPTLLEITRKFWKQTWPRYRFMFAAVLKITRKF